MQECWFRNPDKTCGKYSGAYLECDGACGWVADYIAMIERNENKEQR